MPESAPIPFGGPRTFASYRKAQRFHLRRTLRRSIVIGALIGVAVLYALAMAVVHRSFEEAVPSLVLLGFVLGFAALMELSVRRSWKTHKAIREAVEGAFTDECLETQSTIGSSKIPWSYFLKWASSGDVLLLYQADNCVNILTRDLFATEQDWRRALALVAEKVPKRPKGAGRRMLLKALLWLAIVAAAVYFVMR